MVAVHSLDRSTQPAGCYGVLPGRGGRDQEKISIALVIHSVDRYGSGEERNRVFKEKTRFRVDAILQLPSASFD